MSNKRSNRSTASPQATKTSTGTPIRWEELKELGRALCGGNWQADCDDHELAVLYRALLGRSTRSEVASHGGFTGTWDPEIQPVVDDFLYRMERSKKYKKLAKRQREDHELPPFTPLSKRRKAGGEVRFAPGTKTASDHNLMAKPPKLPTGWTKVTDSEGKTHFHNAATGTLQFHRPEHEEEAQPTAASAQGPAADNTQGVASDDATKLLNELLAEGVGGGLNGMGVPDQDTLAQQSLMKDVGHPSINGLPDTLVNQLESFLKNQAVPRPAHAQRHGQGRPAHAQRHGQGVRAPDARLALPGSAARARGHAGLVAATHEPGGQVHRFVWGCGGSEPDCHPTSVVPETAPAAEVRPAMPPDDVRRPEPRNHRGHDRARARLRGHRHADEGGA